MNIKRCFLMAAALMSLAAFTSCSKEGIGFFKGSYGFVTSGSVECAGEYDLPVIECPLLRESGTLRIEPKGNAAVLTMSSVLGDALVFDAVIEGTEITLKPVKRIITMEVQEDVVDKIKTIPVTMSGKGYKTNGLMVLDISYTSDDFDVNMKDGLCVVAYKYRISGSNVSCVANFRE